MLKENNIMLKENEVTIQGIFKSIPILVGVITLMITLVGYLTTFAIRVSILENKVATIEVVQTKLIKENEDSKAVEIQFRADIQVIKDTMIEMKDVLKTALRK